MNQNNKKSLWPIKTILAEKINPEHKFLVQWENTWEDCIDSLPEGFQSKWPKQKILEEKSFLGKTKYLVQWSPTWVNEQNVCPKDIDDFRKKNLQCCDDSAIS